MFKQIMKVGVLLVGLMGLGASSLTGCGLDSCRAACDDDATQCRTKCDDDECRKECTTQADNCRVKCSDND